MSELPKIRGLTLKGAVLAELSINGPGTHRELSDRLARHYGYEPDDYWRISGEVVYEALVDNLGRVNLWDGVWSIADGPK